MLKVVLIVVCSLILLIVLMVAAGMAVMKHEYKDVTDVLKSAQTAAKKALVVYQPSLTKACRDVAYAIAGGLHDSGYEVTITNPRKQLTADSSPYSVIVFGSPNYGSSVAEALTEYVKRISSFEGKKVILFSTSGGVNIMTELNKLAELLNGVKPYTMVKYKFTQGDKNRKAAYQLSIEAAKE